MISAFSLCLLTLAVSAASSQVQASNELDDVQIPISERRTFKNPKPVKFLPLLKKHKKFGGWIPHHSFGKTEYVEVPITHEVPIRPIYKIHRYQGVEVKPVSTSVSETIHTSPPETIVESQSFVPPPNDFEPTFNSDISVSSPSNAFVFSHHDKPVFSTPIAPPPEPIFLNSPASLPSVPIFPSISSSLPSKPIFSFIPLPKPTIPIKLPPAQLPPSTVFTSVSIARPSIVPIPAHVPVLPAFHFQPPAPIISSAPASSLPAPISASAQPAPIFTSASILPPPSVPAISHIPPPLPSPPTLTSVTPVPPPATPIFSPVSSLLPPVLSSPLPSPAPIFSSVSVTPAPEPEFPYPPSGTPIPSYIKDISLPDISVKDPPPKVESPNFEEINAAIDSDNMKNLEHVLGIIKPENGFFQKIKDWKTDKANAALSHFSHFKPKPIVHQHVTDKVPVEVPVSNIPSNNLPIYPALQFPSPIHPLPLTPDFRPPPVFFPSNQILPPVKYENFPPNHVESPPPLFNSYGLPIPHDSYAPPLHASHDRVSPAASEEEPSILPPPSNFGDKNIQQNLKEQVQQPETQVSQVVPEFQTKNLHQSQFQPQFLPKEQPIYVPETPQTENEDSQTTEETHLTNSKYQENHQAQSEEISEEVNSNVQNHDNHKQQ